MGSGISTKRRIARELLDAAVVSNINAEAKVPLVFRVSQIILFSKESICPNYV